MVPERRTRSEWLRQAGAGLSDDTVLSKTEALAWLVRPMRLVGVVRNEGQPGTPIGSAFTRARTQGWFALRLWSPSS